MKLVDRMRKHMPLGQWFEAWELSNTLGVTWNEVKEVMLAYHDFEYRSPDRIRRV
jgi:NADH:ubiquinone oxidoreductase subunit E